MDKRIGAQLFTVREFTKTKDGYEDALRRIAEIGYKAVQISAVGEISAEDLKNGCEKYGLIPVCTHRSLQEYRDDLNGMVEFHKLLGCKIAGLGVYPEFVKNASRDTMLKAIEELNEFSRAFREAGMSFAYHNHHWEFQKIDGKFIMDYFLENGKFDFIVDVFWLARAGINPAEYLLKMGKRAKVLHYKDMKVVPGERELQMCEVMEGNLDWDSIIEASEKAGSEWAMVEQDICQNDPFDCLKLSYKNLTQKGFC